MVEGEGHGDILVEARRAAGVDGQLAFAALLAVFELLAEDVVLAADDEDFLAVELLLVVFHFARGQEGGRRGEERYFAECFHLRMFLGIDYFSQPGFWSRLGTLRSSSRCSGMNMYLDLNVRSRMVRYEMMVGE